jgi:diguanylate cyclase (GGDEF)-like protein
MVRAIREELGLDDMRLVLRTGQPGLSPEQSVVEQYDIEEYRLKTELSKSSLVNTMTALLRGYTKLRRIREQATTIALLSQRNEMLIRERSMQGLAQIVLGGVCALLGSPRGLAWLSESELGGPEPIAEFGSIESKDHAEMLRIAQEGARQHDAVLVHWSPDLGYYAPLSLAEIEAGGAHLLVFAYGATERPSEDRRRAMEAFSHSAQNAFDARLMMQRLEAIAYSDFLTGLPNRRLFGQQLDAEIAAFTTGSERQIAVLLIDLDRFRLLNEREGQHRGDRLLEAAARRLRTLAPESAFVSRVGGDEFGIIFKSIDGSDLLHEARRLFREFTGPITVEDTIVELGASAGFADYNAEVSDGAELIRRATSALYQGKQDSRGSITAYENQRASPARRARLGRLKAAILNDELELFYQPKVTLRDRELRGFEALIRWRDPENGLVMPADFLPLAQSAGLMREIDEWVAQAALKQLERWASDGFVTSIAINLAPQHLQNDSFLRHLEHLWASHPPGRGTLTLEIVESAALSDFRQAFDAITELRAKGLRVALDDFGTGYSSLSYLRMLPLDELKIDQSFVLGMQKSAGDTQIVRSITQLAEIFGLTTIAEGVESTDLAQSLHSMGCHVAQGYGIARPMPVNEARLWAEQLSQGRILTDWVWAPT